MRRLPLAALLCLLAVQTAAAQRFGEDRPAPGAPPAPAPVPAPKPVPPAALPDFPTGTPTPTRTPQRIAVAPVAPVVAESPHEWAVRPEHGEWLICVKSYVGDAAKAQAVEMAGLIRTQHKYPAYLFERNAEERQREEQRRAEFRAGKAAELAPFLQLQGQMRAEAAARGVEYADAPTVYRMPKVTIEPQWAVLVGGFPDADAARKALTAIREWAVPANEKLMDRAVTSRPGEDGKAVTSGMYINPYRSAMVSPNPTVRRAPSQANAVDPALFTLNAEEPLSLLKCPKNWTLIVKDFTVPAVVHGKDQESSVMARLFRGDEADKLLHSTARQAFTLATALRSESMERAARAAAAHAGLTPRPLESYVLHHRTGSRVTVGGFDAPDDPALLEMQRLLSNMYFQVADKTAGGVRAEDRRLFDGITPMPVPRKP